MHNTFSMKILIVDDSEACSFLLACYLDESNSEIRFAENGLQALEHVQNNIPDLVITDLNMPVMDGYEMLKVIRKTQDIPIIIASGSDDFDLVQKCYSHGINGFLKKPVSKDALINSIAKIKAIDQFNNYKSHTL
jgi:YesN/AraC family two-component response regulator